MNRVIFIFISLMLAACVAKNATAPLVESVKEIKSVTPAEDGKADFDCSYFYFLWGKNAELEKRYEEAVEAYEKSIVCDEQADYVIRKLAVLLVRMDRKEQALSWIEKIISNQPDDDKAKMFLANLYSSMGEFEKAAEIYAAIIEADNNNSEAMLMLGTLYISNLEYGKALEILKRQVTVDPDSYLGHQYLAKLYRETGDFAKSISAYKRALELNFVSSLAIEAASLYEENDRTDEAIELYRKIIASEHTNEIAVGSLIRIYIELGKNDKALEVLHELRKYTSDTQRVDFSIGRIFLDQGKYDEAIELFSEMLGLYPEFDLAKFIIALAYYEKGEIPRAKEYLLQIPKDAPGYEDAFIMLINIMRKEQDYQAAITLVKQNMDNGTFSNNLELYSVLAGLYHDNGQFKEASNVFENAIAKFPDESGLYFEYGMFLDKSKQYDMAMKQMKTVLELDPENPFAMNYIGYSWAEQGKNLEDALAYIKKALLIKPSDGFIRDSLGWVYFKLGLIEKAILELEKAALVENEDPTILEHLGDAYLKKGLSAEALEAYLKSLEHSEKEEDQNRLRGKIEPLK